MKLPSELSKFVVLTKNTLDTFIAYRASFAIWRLQLFITFLVFYYLWSAIAANKGQVGNYPFASLISYFVIGYAVRAIVFSTRSADLGGDIQVGNISSLLLKPIGTLKYYFSRDIIDKLFNLFFMSFEFLFILLVFKPPLIIPNISNFLAFLFLIAIATVCFFFYSLLISFMAFWSESAWASRFLFGVVIVTLFSGQFIPLDLLPPWLLEIFNYTPFPYFYYYPLRIWLGMESVSGIFLIFLRSILISGFLYFISIIIWRRGLQKYQSYGN